jgi:hypothetical protein
MTRFKEIIGDDNSEDITIIKRVKFNIISDPENPISFCYCPSGDGSFMADESPEIERFEEMGVIKVMERDISYADDIFMGGPEPILYQGKSFIQPCAGSHDIVGEDLEIGKFGDWKCPRCGEIMNLPFSNGHMVEPFECMNDSCGRKAHFIAQFPKELNKPGWKMAGLPISTTGREVYSDIYAYLQTYLILKEDEYHIMALWIMASWLIEDFTTTSYLLFLAPKESGKTQALDALSLLSYRAIKSVSVTCASLFRSIELWHITLLIDESENQLNIHTETGQALYGCLNGGYKRGGVAMRTEGDAGNRQPQNYDLFGFKAIGTTKITHPTLESRSIVFNMTRGIPKKILFDETRAFILRSKLLYWRFSTLHKLHLIIPKSQSARIVEMFIPLFTVAQVLRGSEVGVKVPIKYDYLIALLKKKIRELESYRKVEESTSEEARVIEAIREIIEDKGCNEPNTDFIYSKELALKLKWIDDYSDQKDSIKAYVKLSGILKAMGIEVSHHKHGNGIEFLKDDVKERIGSMIKRYLLDCKEE